MTIFKRHEKDGRGPCSVPSQGTKILHATQQGQKQKKKKTWENINISRKQSRNNHTSCFNLFLKSICIYIHTNTEIQTENTQILDYSGWWDCRWGNLLYKNICTLQTPYNKYLCSCKWLMQTNIFQESIHHTSQTRISEEELSVHRCLREISSAQADCLKLSAALDWDKTSHIPG